MTTYNVNGVTIETSHLGRSGYLGCTFSPAWTLDYDNPFIAMTSNPINDPRLEKWLTAKKRMSLHLGNFGDSREAAYVVSLYKQNPEEILKEIYNKEFAPSFPDSLYDLPVYINKEEAQNIINITKTKSKTRMPKLQHSDILQVARNCAKHVNLSIASRIRKDIDFAFKNKKYNNVEEVEMHVNELMKEHK